LRQSRYASGRLRRRRPPGAAAAPEAETVDDAIHVLD